MVTAANAAAWADDDGSAERDEVYVRKALAQGGFPAWSESLVMGRGGRRRLSLGPPLIRPERSGRP